ncbi:acyl-CoA dehydratase activase-related protein [Chitinispirillales bacterium ANBcel5]|uniref:acyl-CoA dehydratase activase-related protein n=1 Tax=Cellulosispirillum alkaliphilum TaxID=3039283 RepID=UPI002A50B00B|nr:acyl-CoA dehydratase activase-related protein [Chitinispirillales bacterium ANBcel5]
MKIGIPQALGFYYYGQLWKEFLTQLGCTVIESQPSNREVLQSGTALTPSEACLPLKCFVGHVQKLITKVDALFIPRMVCMKKEPVVGLGCPKYIGLPDMVKALFPQAKVVTPYLDLRKAKEQNAFAQSVRGLGFTRKQALRAFNAAKDTISSKQAESKGFTFGSDNHLTIAVIGHSYLVHDKFLSLDIIKRLSAMSCRVVDYTSFGSSGMSRSNREPLSWFFEEDILCSAEKLIASSHIDGIVYMLSFGCGAGSITSEILELELRKDESMPLLKLVIDEHTGEAGIVTRLESYIDMLTLRKERR